MRINKRNNKEFVEGVCQKLLEIGANKVIDEISSFKSFKLQTIVGDLLINVPIDNSFCFTIFSRFVDVELASQKFDCNPYSGKYNVHIAPETPFQNLIESAIAPFKSLKNHE